MTEQRFRLDTGCFIDNETGEILSDVKVRNLLNKQDKEIKLLQNRFGRAKQRIRRQSKDLDKYFDYFRRELNWDCERILEEVFK